VSSFDEFGDLRKSATLALNELRGTVLALLERFPSGLKNAQIAEILGIASRRGAPQRNRLVWQIVEQLENEKLIVRDMERPSLYRLADPSVVSVQTKES
jgi:hypothetical protein